jgi:hypothetical protein
MAKALDSQARQGTSELWMRRIFAFPVDWDFNRFAWFFLRSSSINSMIFRKASGVIPVLPPVLRCCTLQTYEVLAILSLAEEFLALANETIVQPRGHH